MRDLQAHIIEELGVKPSIDPAEEVRKRVQFLVDYLKATGTRGFVLGISGGLDSTLAGRLCQLAVEQLELAGVEAEFIAVRLPYKVQADEDDAQAALRFIMPQQTVTYNIAEAVDGFESAFETATGRPIADFNKGNVKARARMPSTPWRVRRTCWWSAPITALRLSPASLPSSVTVELTSCPSSV